MCPGCFLYQKIIDMSLDSLTIHIYMVNDT